MALPNMGHTPITVKFEGTKVIVTHPMEMTIMESAELHATLTRVMEREWNNARIAPY